MPYFLVTTLLEWTVLLIKVSFFFCSCSYSC